MNRVLCVDGEKDLAWIENVARVECLLDRSHDGHGRLPRLVDESLALAETDTVLAGAGPSQGDDLAGELLGRPMGSVARSGVGRIEEEQGMEVAIGHVSEHGPHEGLAGKDRLGAEHRLRQQR